MLYMLIDDSLYSKKACSKKRNIWPLHLYRKEVALLKRMVIISICLSTYMWSMEKFGNLTVCMNNI